MAGSRPGSKATHSSPHAALQNRTISTPQPQKSKKSPGSQERTPLLGSRTVSDFDRTRLEQRPPQRTASGEIKTERKGTAGTQDSLAPLRERARTQSQLSQASGSGSPKTTTPRLSSLERARTSSQRSASPAQELVRSRAVSQNFQPAPALQDHKRSISREDAATGLDILSRVGAGTGLALSGQPSLTHVPSVADLAFQVLVETPHHSHDQTFTIKAKRTQGKEVTLGFDAEGHPKLTVTPRTSPRAQSQHSPGDSKSLTVPIHQRNPSDERKISGVKISYKQLPQDVLAFSYQQPYEGNTMLQAPNLTQPEQLEIARKMLITMHNNIDPLSNSEYSLVVLSIVAGASTAITTHDFSTKFFQNVMHIDHAVAEWGGTAIAFIPQWLLSSKKGIDLWPVIFRNLPYLTKKDVKSNWFPVTVVVASSIPTFKVAVDCRDFSSVPGLSYGIGALRSISSFTFNGSFFIDWLRAKKMEAKKKHSPILRLLCDAKNQLNAKGLNSERLLSLFVSEKNKNLLNMFRESEELTENKPSPIHYQTVISMLEVFLNLATQDLATATKPSAQLLGGTLGFLSSIMNWKTATKVPELFSLPITKDIIHFVKLLLENVDEKLIWAFIIGGGIIGIPSLFLNFLANKAACENLYNRVAEIYEEGVFKHFGKYTGGDWAIGFFTTIFSLGLGFANGGMGYKYPFIEYEFVKIANAITNGLVFTGLGFMSIDGFVTGLADKRNSELVRNAVNAPDLREYFQGLTKEQQERFFSSLKKHLKAIIDSLCNDIVNISPEKMNDFLPQEILDKLKNIEEMRLKRDLLSYTLVELPREAMLALENKNPSGIDDRHSASEFKAATRDETIHPSRGFISVSEPKEDLTEKFGEKMVLSLEDLETADDLENYEFVTEVKAESKTETHDDDEAHEDFVVVDASQETAPLLSAGAAGSSAYGSTSGGSFFFPPGSRTVSRSSTHSSPDPKPRRVASDEEDGEHLVPEAPISGKRPGHSRSSSEE